MSLSYDGETMLSTTSIVIFTCLDLLTRVSCTDYRSIDLSKSYDGETVLSTTSIVIFTCLDLLT